MRFSTKLSFLMPKTLQDVFDATNSCRTGLPFLRTVYRVSTGGHSDLGSTSCRLNRGRATPQNIRPSSTFWLNLPTGGDRDSATFVVHPASLGPSRWGGPPSWRFKSSTSLRQVEGFVVEPGSSRLDGKLLYPSRGRYLIGYPGTDTRFR